MFRGSSLSSQRQRALPASIIGGAAAAVSVALLRRRNIPVAAVTQVNIAKAQPIPFSHQRHVAATASTAATPTSVEESGVANVPPTETCMTCHSQISPTRPCWNPSTTAGSPVSPSSGRVYDPARLRLLRSQHPMSPRASVAPCHGNIQDQRLTHKANNLHMAWCLECHRAPEKFIRPKDKVFDVDWKAPKISSKSEAGPGVQSED